MDGRIYHRTRVIAMRNDRHFDPETSGTGYEVCTDAYVDVYGIKKIISY